MLREYSLFLMCFYSCVTIDTVNGRGGLYLVLMLAAVASEPVWIIKFRDSLVLPTISCLCALYSRSEYVYIPGSRFEMRIQYNFNIPKAPLLGWDMQCCVKNTASLVIRRKRGCGAVFETTLI